MNAPLEAANPPRFSKNHDVRETKVYIRKSRLVDRCEWIVTFECQKVGFYPRDATTARVLSMGLCVCLSGCLPQAGIASKRLHVGSILLILHCVLRKLGYLQNKGSFFRNFIPNSGFGRRRVRQAIRQSMMLLTWQRWAWSDAAMNSRPMTVTCWSHSASSFVYSVTGDWAWRKSSLGSIGNSW